MPEEIYLEILTPSPPSQINEDITDIVNVPKRIETVYNISWEDNNA